MQLSEKFYFLVILNNSSIYHLVFYFNQIFKQITIAAKIEMADKFHLMGAVKIILLSDPPKLVYSDSGSVKSAAINKSTVVWNRMLCSFRKETSLQGAGL